MLFAKASLGLVVEPQSQQNFMLQFGTQFQATIYLFESHRNQTLCPGKLLFQQVKYGYKLLVVKSLGK